MRVSRSHLFSLSPDRSAGEGGSQRGFGEGQRREREQHGRDERVGRGPEEGERTHLWM